MMRRDIELNMADIKSENNIMCILYKIDKND